MKTFFVLFAILISSSVSAQHFDVLHYKYEIVLSDESDKIIGKATVKTKMLTDSLSLTIHLSRISNGKGMQVLRILSGREKIRYVHAGQMLTVIFDKMVKKGEEREFEIYYEGIPSDGLIISKNKYGNRTFFADNWPDRARNWIPCNDIPGDKASVEFIVTGPVHYQVIANGVQVEETNISKNKKLTHWKEDKPIPTKVMVIGAADFAVKQVSSTADSISVSAWVYPENREKGFHDYALANEIVRFFSNYIGAYPFEKLANVQSKTIFGGMENASAIFYYENSVDGKGTAEALIAHEVAHQWFGNTATETHYSHLWLSEGFATYMTNIFMEHKYGRDSLVKRLQQEKREVINFAKRSNNPVVDSTSAFMDLLNANSYKKGGWILHMLRQEVGDQTFKNIIRTYYEKYKFKNADTRNFQQVAETVSGKDMKWFFDQWLYKPGIPQLDVQSRLVGNELFIDIIQQKNVFQFPLEIMIIDAEDVVKTHRIDIDEKETKLSFKVKGPVKFALDPDEKLLFIEK